MDNDNIGNLLDIISIVIGYQNLIENRQQSADNDVNRSNQEQAQLILDDLHEQFKLQNQMLAEILNILKGDKK